MTLRIYVAAVLMAAAMTGVALAMIANGHAVAGTAVSSIALLLALAPLLWLLKETRR